MIFIERSTEPEILTQQGKALSLALCTQYDQGTRSFDFDNTVYGNPTVKECLVNMQHGKCCFCESKILHIAYGDVEHYRPKAGYRQTHEDALQKPGYFWLAYTWENLLLSCERCNRQYKKNLFPLQHHQKRAKSHHDDLVQETPLLINPTLTDPKAYIGFRDEVPFPLDDNPFAETTIAILGLDREELNEIRRTKLAELKTLLSLINIVEARPNQDDLKQLAEDAKQLLQKAVLPEAEFSAMAAAIMI